mmetsp:Transcript_16971/g.30489  ORF Transcript_16971/g.30489 Transcript_16971/m.30489 type:complete len:140 (+) Transcript_16971:1570-1989(+)
MTISFGARDWVAYRPRPEFCSPEDTSTPAYLMSFSFDQLVKAVVRFNREDVELSDDVFTAERDVNGRECLDASDGSDLDGAKASATSQFCKHQLVVDMRQNIIVRADDDARLLSDVLLGGDPMAMVVRSVGVLAPGCQF